MRRNVLIVSILLMLAVAIVPMPASAEVVTQAYDPSWGLAFGNLAFGVHFPATFGGAELVASKPYSSVNVGAADGASVWVPLTVCEGSPSFVWGPVPATCQRGCNNVLLPFSSGSGDRVTAFVHWYSIEPDLTVCFATSGTVTGTFA